MADVMETSTKTETTLNKDLKISMAAGQKLTIIGGVHNCEYTVPANKKFYGIIRVEGSEEDV